MEKTTLSVQELSAQMGISLPKAYELVKTPGFPTIRIGTRIVIPTEAYKEWLVRNIRKKIKNYKKGVRHLALIETTEDMDLLELGNTGR